MPKKTYKNKGIPVKGKQVRIARNIRLSDSAWSGLDEVAKILNMSRGDLIEWWAAILTTGEEKFRELAENENLSLEEANNLLWEQLPDRIQQLMANKPSNGMAVNVKPKDEVSESSADQLF